MTTMHIFAQSQWHDEAFIVGDREALKRLRDALTEAIDGDGVCKSDQFVNDGEGYSTWVVAVSKEQAQKLMLPYTDEMAQERSVEGKVKHWELVRNARDTSQDRSKA